MLKSIKNPICAPTPSQYQYDSVKKPWDFNIATHRDTIEFVDTFWINKKCSIISQLLQTDISKHKYSHGKFKNLHVSNSSQGIHLPLLRYVHTSKGKTRHPISTISWYFLQHSPKHKKETKKFIVRVYAEEGSTFPKIKKKNSSLYL